ncbi:MAG: aminoacyl-tRNA hydrolase [Planctomycetes bacterium]|nr:aminoacyl-tRNA hydrolase [Planctomycetota bacterium]
MEPAPGSVRLAPGVTVPAAAITVTASRAGGPGGQNVNNTSSKAELRLPVAAIIGLSPAAGDRLAMLAGFRLTAGGELLIVCDETRSLRTNREMAMERLRELVLAAQAVPRPRKRTRPGRGAIERRLQNKAATSARKKDRKVGGE